MEAAATTTPRTAEEQKQQGPTYTNHNGFLMPAGFPSENFDNSLQYQVQDSDIIVTTYPKCGTTWVQNIIWLLMNNGTPFPASQKLTKLFPHLEEVGCEGIEALETNPRLIKTHLPYDMTPMNPKAKYVYVARNPKDCVVSFFHHTRGFTKIYDYEHGQFDDYFELFLQGKVDFGDYFDNLTSWWCRHRNDPHILFITYEQLTLKTRDTILKIASFLRGKELTDQLLANNELILSAVIEHSSFQGMSKDTQRWSSKRLEGHTSFIRKGGIGDWKNHLSQEQSDRMNERIRERLTAKEIEDLWPMDTIGKEIF